MHKLEIDKSIIVKNYTRLYYFLMMTGRALIILCLLILTLSISNASELKWKYKTKNEIMSVSMSSDGRYVAVGSYDHHVYFFDRNGNLLWKYKVDGPVISLVSSDGNYVAAGSTGNAFLKAVWTRIYFFNKHGELLWKYESDKGSVGCIAITPDGRYIVAGTQGVWDWDREKWIAKPTIFLLDRNGKLLWKREVNNSVEAIAICPDGEYIAARTGYTTTYAKPMLYVFDKNGRILWKIPKRALWPLSYIIKMSPDGKYVVANVKDFGCDALYFFDKNGKLLWKYIYPDKHLYYISSIDVSRHYVVMSVVSVVDKSVLFFNKDGKLLWKLKVEPTNLTDIGMIRKLKAVISDNEEYIAIVGANGLVILDKNGNLLWRYEFKDGNAVDISSDGRYVVAGDVYGNVYLFEINLTYCYLNVNSNPEGAEIYVDGLFVGVTPKIVSLSQGYHELKIVKKGYHEFYKNINVTPDMLGKTYGMKVKLKLAQTETMKRTPGFEIVLAAIGILIAYVLRRR